VKPVICFMWVYRLGEQWGLCCQEVKVGRLLKLLMLLRLSYLTLNTFGQSLHNGIL
jgi:hypothetical protein